MNTTPKAILLEANEIPFRVVDDYVEQHPGSHLAALMADSKQFDTVCEDQVELDPWISWPTLHRGVIDEQHRILHLGQSLESADRQYPPIWRLLSAAGVTVGVMGSLHSSHVPEDAANYAFYVPDFFANQSFAHPAEVTAFQQFNLLMTRMSARNVATDLPPIRSAADFLRFYATHGISRSTLTTTFKELWNERRDPHLKCRRRSIQPLLSLDIFLDLMRRTAPQFATLYTNHVAAAMHRYWAAAYPDDPDGSDMPADWRDRYRHEIHYAMDCLDIMIGRLMTYADKNGYLLIMASSMGQAAHKSEVTDGFTTVVDLNRFMATMGLSTSEWTEQHAMVPCVSVTVDPARVDDFERRLSSITCQGHAMSLRRREEPPLSYDRSGDDTFHLFVYFERYSGPQTALLAGSPISFEQLGWGFHEHQDNIDCTGRHTPHGLLVVHDSAVPAVRGQGRSRISTLDIAPAILDHFGAAVPGYMNRADAAIMNPGVTGTAVVVRASGGGVETPVIREAAP